MDRGKYPPNWEYIRARKLSKMWAKEGVLRCEGTPMFPNCRARNRQLHPETGSNVVLTVAHMDHNPGNNAEGNLRALCQRCHLAWDAEQHAVNAALTRRQRKRNLELWPEKFRRPL